MSPRELKRRRYTEYTCTSLEVHNNMLSINVNPPGAAVSVYKCHAQIQIAQSFAFGYLSLRATEVEDTSL